MEFVGNAENQIADLKSLNELRCSGAKIVMFFWAAWHEPSKPNGSLQEAFTLLASKYAKKGIKFYS